MSIFFFSKLQILKKQSYKPFNFKEDSIFEYLFRVLSIFITPFFLILKISPNSISLVSLIFGIISFFYLLDSQLFYSIIFIFFSILIDYVDGNVARFIKKTSFFGRFIDGLIDIFIISLFRFGLFIYFYLNFFELNTLNYFIFIFAIITTPINHFIYDRYSALIRWSNDVNQLRNTPYIRFTNDLYGRIHIILIDINFFLLFLIPFYNNPSSIILIYFISSLLCNLYNISLHIYSALKFMNNLPNEKRNKQ